MPPLSRTPSGDLSGSAGVSRVDVFALGWFPFVGDTSYSRPNMLVEEHVIDGATEAYARSVWLAKGPASDAHPLCVLLDGEFYLERVEALTVLAQATKAGRIPAMTYVFVSYVDAGARHVDLTCNDRYARFITNDVIGWARARVPSIRERDHVICGLSLSGLQSAYIALHHPSVFRYAVCQSGSFWWKPEQFAQMARALSPIPTRFWLSVGDEETEENVSHPPTGLFQEISQIAGVEQAAAVLADSGADVHVRQYRGGHEPAPWKDEFAAALEWLLR